MVTNCITIIHLLTELFLDIIKAIFATVQQTSFRKIRLYTKLTVLPTKTYTGKSEIISAKKNACSGDRT